MIRKSTGFPSRQTRSVCPEIMLKQKDRAGMTIRRKVIPLWIATISIMRRRFVGGAGRMRLGLAQALAQVGNLARQRVDLEPLRGDGLVQRLDGFVLKRQPHFEYVDPVAERLHITHRNPAPSGAPASRGRARRGRRTQNIRRASGSRLPERPRYI